MALPKLNTPSFGLTLFSTGKRITFRPFVVKEEKTLLMAAQSEDPNDMIDAVKNTIESCVLDKSVSINSLPYFDVEHIFLNIRAKSVGEIVKLEYRHAGGKNYSGVVCEAVTPVEINLENVQVEKKEGHSNKIQLDERLGVEMRYPNFDDIKLLSQGTDEIKLLAKCIVCVYDNEEVYDPDNLEDSVEFLESLSSNQFANILKFVETMPKLKHTFTYKCRGCGQEDKVTLEGLADFF